MQAWTRPIVICAAVVPVLLAGCGPATSTVGGVVTVDGKPLEKGVIVFAPTDGAVGTAVTANIENGHYELQTLPGKKLVQISAPVVIGKRKEHNGPNAPLVEVTGERLPARYNSNSELTFDVASGGNTKDWALVIKARLP